MRRHAPLVAVAALAGLVRLVGAYTQSFWQDEVASARILAEPTLPGVVHHVAKTESTPPLWYVLAWLAHEAGLGFQETRLLSVIAGAGSAAAALVIARRVGGPLAGLVAGLLVALGGQFLVYGESIRAYALLVLLAAAFALVLLDTVRDPSRRRLAGLALVVAAGALTHYYFVLSVVAALAWLWLEPTAARARRRVTAAIAVGGAVTAPWAVEAVRQYDQNRFWWIGAFRLRNVAGAPLRLFSFAFSDSAAGPAVSVAALVLVAYGCVLLARSPSGRLVVALALVPLAVAGSLWAAGLRVYALRNLLEIGPFVAAAAATAIAALPRPRLAAAALVGLLAVSSAVSEIGRVPPYDHMAHELVANGWTPAAPIGVVGDPLRLRGPLEWYLPHRPVLVPVTARSACARVFLLRHDHVSVVPGGTPRPGVTYLGDSAHLPRCVRRVRTAHAALA